MCIIIIIIIIIMTMMMVMMTTSTIIIIELITITKINLSSTFVLVNVYTHPVRDNNRQTNYNHITAGYNYMNI